VIHALLSTASSIDDCGEPYRAGGGTMKILLGVLAIVVIGASLFVDYKWRQWIASRKRDRE
jgi:hypothetical protein